MKKSFTFISIMVLAGLLVSGIALAFPITAMAKSVSGQIEDALKKAYQGEQTWLSKQTEVIAKSDEAGAKVQQVIEKAAAEGLDVSALQSALDAFNSEMATVKADHQTAVNLLSPHNGFDANDNVTDRQTARQTVLDAKQALWHAHVTMVKALADLHAAVLNWKNASFPR